MQQDKENKRALEAQIEDMFKTQQAGVGEQAARKEIINRLLQDTLLD